MTAIALASCVPSWAQSYPDKAVKIVVPFAAGGGVDVLTRILAQRLGPELGTQVVVDAVPGAAGNAGSALVAHAAPDGYTLLMATTGTHTINPGLYKDMPFDAVRDFAPITLVASVPNVLIVGAQVPASTVRELATLARANPGKLKFASSGYGTSNYLSGELFKSVANIDVAHLPYKNAPQAVVDLIAGRVTFAFINAPVALPQVRAGKLRALAITGAQRSPVAPALPTMSEAGFPDFVVESWNGLMAPARTPRAVIDKVRAATLKVLAMPEVREAFAQRGADIETSTPEQFASMIAIEKTRWAKIIKMSGAKSE
jgi:tripartite-type tricarboxylate transporter receptor subunit TctC